MSKIISRKNHKQRGKFDVCTLVLCSMSTVDDHVEKWSLNFISTRHCNIGVTSIKVRLTHSSKQINTHAQHLIVSYAILYKMTQSLTLATNEKPKW